MDRPTTKLNRQAETNYGSAKQLIAPRKRIHLNLNLKPTQRQIRPGTVGYSSTKHPHSWAIQYLKHLKATNNEGTSSTLASAEVTRVGGYPRPQTEQKNIRPDSKFNQLDQNKTVKIISNKGIIQDFNKTSSPEKDLRNTFTPKIIAAFTRKPTLSPPLKKQATLPLERLPETPNPAQTARIPSLSELNLSSLHSSTDFIERRRHSNVEEYAIGKQIGQGAYAIVKLAVNKTSQQKFALKIYDKFKLLDPQKKKNVQREIRILERIEHPYIVGLHEIINTTRQLYLVLEYIQGLSLNEYLKRRPNRRVEELEARQIFKQVLIGVKHCHENNVTHRDLKLDNLLLDGENNVKIIDFGFATCFPHDRKTKLFCGTPSYMSPEIVARKEYSGPPADVWALGVILYALVCGSFPFRAPHDRELYRKIQRGQFIIPKYLSQELKDLLKRIIVVEPENRPSAEDLLKDAWFTIDKISCDDVSTQESTVTGAEAWSGSITRTMVSLINKVDEEATKDLS